MSQSGAQKTAEGEWGPWKGQLKPLQTESQELEAVLKALVALALVRWAEMGDAALSKGRGPAKASQKKSPHSNLARAHHCHHHEVSGVEQRACQMASRGSCRSSRWFAQSFAVDVPNFPGGWTQAAAAATMQPSGGQRLNP